MSGREQSPATTFASHGRHGAGEWLLPLLVHLAAAAVLALVSVLASDWVALPLRGPARMFAALCATAYLAAALPRLLFRDAADPGLWRTAVHGLAAFGVAFMLFALAQWRAPSIAGSEMPAIAAFAALGTGMFLLLALALIRNAAVLKLLVLVAVAIVAAWGNYRHHTRPKRPPTREVAYVDTSLYVLKSTSYRKKISDGDTRGGAIAPLADGYLLVAGDGGMYFVRENAARTALETGKLNYRAPFNPDEFRDGGRRIFGDSWRDNSMDKLRIADLLVQERDDGRVRLFVSHHFWYPDQACFVVRVSVLEGSLRELRDPAGPLAWRTLYETTPCLKLNTEGGRGLRFGGLQVGGAMAQMGDDEMLLTVGDHEFDGFKRTEALPQDASSSYGKVLRIRLDTGQSAMYTLGHRNPQGLYAGPDGAVWVLEHGPRGGDELNLLRPGANYGWPQVTYGTDYRMHEWPLSPTPGRHDGFEKPIFAFVPSIAVSQLAGIRGPLFERWRGDLLAGSFFGGLVRIRVEDGRVVFAEPIRIQGRIRDVSEGRDGRVLVWTDENDLIFLEPAASDAAESLLTQCIVCHTLSPRETVAIAPSLRGIVGRPVAAAKGFAYSEAMSRFGGRWTEERLDRFLESPSAVVPGTTMGFAGIADADERRQIIELLQWQVDEQREPR